MMSKKSVGLASRGRRSTTLQLLLSDHAIPEADAIPPHSYTRSLSCLNQDPGLARPTLRLSQRSAQTHLPSLITTATVYNSHSLHARDFTHSITPNRSPWVQSLAFYTTSTSNSTIVGGNSEASAIETDPSAPNNTSKTTTQASISQQPSSLKSMSSISSTQHPATSSASAPTSTTSTTSNQPKSPGTQQLNACYRSHKSIKQRFSDPATFPYPISDATRRNLLYELELQLSGFGDKSIAVACPHPGAVAYLEDSVMAAAAEIGADVLVLDHLTVLRILKEASAWRKAPLTSSSSSSSANSSSTSSSWSTSDDRDTKLTRKARISAIDSSSRSFSPADYRIHQPYDDIDDEYYDEDEEMDEDEDDLAHDTKTSRHGSVIIPSNINVKLSLCPGLASAPVAEIIPIVNGSKGIFASAQSDKSGNDDGKERTGIIGENQTYYHQSSIYWADLDIFVQSILSVIRSKAKKSAAGGASSKVILFYRDATDSLETHKEAGRRILSSLLELVKHSRNDQQIPIALVAGCTPSLLRNTGRDSLDESAEFYSHLFSGRVVSSSEESDSQPISLAADGLLFRTCLDHHPNFETVIIPPPSPGLLSSFDMDTAAFATSIVATGDTSAAVTPIPRESLVESYKAWLHSMELSHRLRNRELNWRAITAYCQDHGVSITGVSLTDLLPPLPLPANTYTLNFDPIKTSKTPHTTYGGLVTSRYQCLFNNLNTSLWSFARIQKFVRLAVGFKLKSDNAAAAATTTTAAATQTAASTSAATSAPLSNSPPSVGKPSGVLNLTISLAHIMEAMRLMQETQYKELDGDEIIRGPDSVYSVSEDVDGGKGALKGEGSKGDGGGGIGVVQEIIPETTASKTNTTTPSVTSSNLLPDTPESQVAELKKLMKRDGHKLSSYETKLLSTVISPSKIPVGFSDIVLPPATKMILQTLVSLPLLQPEHFASGILSRHSITGVLLFGPPGTGKTMLAKAVAKSSGARFMSVALSDVFDKYVGEGEKNTRAIFTLARKLSPCVVFLDEVDALFAARRGGDGLHSSKREIINEFMSEWDGLMSANKGVIIMGATNRPFDLDDAILRRMPRRVLIDLPDEAARLKILQTHLKDESLDDSVTLDSLAKRTHLYSGSDLKNVCVSAALAAVKEAVARPLLKNIQSENTEVPEKLASLSTEEVLKRVDNLDGWDMLKTASPTTSSSKSASTVVSQSPVQKRTLNMAHFEAALKEVPPSLTDEMHTLVELRKWDEMYGDGAARRKGAVKKGWGFGQEVVVAPTPAVTVTK